MGTTLLAMLDYAVRGRKQYKGPVVLVEGYKGH
jgi:choline transport protein